MASKSRKLSDWLTAYLEYTSSTEPPLSYHEWVGVGLIAGALQRKVHLKWGFEVLYPNFYIVLVGPSGRCRKGMAMKLGRDIFSAVGLPMSSESITREALIRRIHGVSTTYNTPDQRVVSHSSITCMSPELSVFLGQGDLRFLADLTDWYDCNPKWTYETKNAGIDQIEGICFNLIGATAADWLQAILPSEAIGGGFTSRIIFVVEENKRQIVAEDIRTKEQDELFEALTHDLGKIAVLNGLYTFTKEAAEMYRNWYVTQEEAAAQGRYAISDPKFGGYCDRRATHLRKLSMVMSASHRDELLIDVEDFERALGLLARVEANMPRVFGGIGSSKYSEIMDKMLQFIKAVKRVSRSGLLKRFYRDIDAYDLAQIETMMTQMKVVQTSINTNDGETYYTYVGE